MALNPNDTAAVGGISRSDVELTLSRMKRYFPYRRWLSRDNRYTKDTIGRIRADLAINSINQRAMAQYIVASSVLHANDGWSYLGRAISSVLAGDAHRAIHLGYYAELRASMALLASSGIGIFNNKHIIVSGENATRTLTTGERTHDAAWTILQCWSRLPTSGALFADLVKIDGHSLAAWFQPIGGTTSLEAQARDWFLQWGMDLDFALDDRTARNESSYRPDGIPTSWTIAAPGSLSFVQELWRVLEPRANASFQEIDRYILRTAVERHFENTTGRKPRATDPLYQTMVQSVVGNLYAGVTATRWRDFLLRRTLPLDPTVFALSAKRPGRTGSDHLAVISRAALLLRMATGSTEKLLQDAGVSSTDVQFWWEEIGETRGLWSPGSPPAARGDLWQDIEDTLNDVGAIIASVPEATQSLNRARSDMGGFLDVLCTHERVGLWGLCP